MTLGQGAVIIGAFLCALEAFGVRTGGVNVGWLGVAVAFVGVKFA